MIPIHSVIIPQKLWDIKMAINKSIKDLVVSVTIEEVFNLYKDLESKDEQISLLTKENINLFKSIDKKDNQIDEMSNRITDHLCEKGDLKKKLENSRLEITELNSALRIEKERRV